MPGCTLRISGEQPNLDKALQTVTFCPYRRDRKGEPRGRSGRVHEEAGFHVSVSDASGHDLAQQLEDAESFLAKHCEELQGIKVLVSNALLDFGCFCRIGTGVKGNEKMMQTDCFSPSLLKLCGDLCIGISISYYAVSGSDVSVGEE